DPAGVATQERAVETELFVHDGDLIGRGGLTDDGERRVSRCEVEQQARKQRHEQEHDEQVQQATAYESQQCDSMVSVMVRREAADGAYRAVSHGDRSSERIDFSPRNRRSLTRQAGV